MFLYYSKKKKVDKTLDIKNRNKRKLKMCVYLQIKKGNKRKRYIKNRKMNVTEQLVLYSELNPNPPTG